MPEEEAEELLTSVRRDPMPRVLVDERDRDAVDQPPPGWARSR